jgi:hypothetical protein
MANRFATARGGSFRWYAPLLILAAVVVLGIFLLLNSSAATDRHQTAQAPPANTVTPPPVSSSAALTSFPVTTEGIHIATGWPGSWQVALTYDKGKTDDIEGARMFLTPSVRSALHSTHISHYLSASFAPAMNPKGASPEVKRFNGAHSLAWYQANHPDWVVYQCDRKTPAYYNGSFAVLPAIPLDFSNPAVMAFMATRAIARLKPGPSDGVFFDHMFFVNHFGACGVYKGGPKHPRADWTLLNWGANGESNQTYLNARLAYLRYIRAALAKAFPNKNMTITINSSPTSNGITTIPHASRYLGYIDADFDETGFVNHLGQRPADSKWQELMSGLELLNRGGRAVIISNYAPPYEIGSPQQHDLANWVLANYLLVKGTHSYVIIDGPPWAPGCPPHDACIVDLPEYHVPIGHPTATSPQIGDTNRLYTRRYSGGLAIVNPSGSQSFSTTLGKTYQDMYGGRVRSVTLSPATGIVLLNSAVQ